MTVNQYTDRLKCAKKQLEEGKYFEIAVRDNLAQRSRRIFTDGENTSGGKIGRYDTTKPLYVNPLSGSPKKFAAKGKNGNTNFKNSKPHKTGFFPSYSSFRVAIGRDGGYMTLQLFGDLKSNFENSSRGVPEPVKINNLEYVVGLDGANAKKRAGIEKRFGNVFFSQEKEKSQFLNVAAFEQNQIIKQCLND